MWVDSLPLVLKSLFLPLRLRHFEEGGKNLADINFNDCRKRFIIGQTQASSGKKKKNPAHTWRHAFLCNHSVCVQWLRIINDIIQFFCYWMLKFPVNVQVIRGKKWLTSHVDLHESCWFWKKWKHWWTQRQKWVCFCAGLHASQYKTNVLISYIMVFCCPKTSTQ